MQLLHFLKKNNPKKSTADTQFSSIYPIYIYIYNAFIHSVKVGRYF